MRQGNWCAAVGGFLAVSLLCNPAWAGDKAGASDQAFLDIKSRNQEAAGSGVLIPRMETPPLDFSDTGLEPSAIDPDDELVWDNKFAAVSGGFILANQCEDLECGDPGSEVLSLLADDIDLPAGTVVRGFKIRFGFRNPAREEEILGVHVFFWKDTGKNGTDIPDNALEPGLGSPGSDGPRGPGRFLIEGSDPGFSEFSEGPNNVRLEVTFNAGEQWVAPGGRVWVTLVPIVDFAPQTFSFVSQFPLNAKAVLSFQPIDPAEPWNDEGDNPSIEEFDTQFQLFGEIAKGGVTVVTLSKGVTGGQNIRLGVTQVALSDCTAGACNADPATCQASYTTSGGDTASVVADGLANNFTAANINNLICGGPSAPLVRMQAAGPRVIVTTEESIDASDNGGPRPNVCLGVVGGDLIGGPNSCEPSHAGTGLNFQVGLRDDQVLPPIEPGLDNFATTRTCPNARNGADTWMEMEFPAEMFDRPGLPPAKGIPTQRIAFSGVGVAFSNSDEDTIVERLEAIRFGECSGDFTDSGGGNTLRNPNGIVNVDDQDSFDACVGNIATDDCAFFDYNGDGAIDLADADVFTCLLLSGNSRDCCPENLNLPQTTPFPSGTRLRRLVLHSCDPLEVLRQGKNNWPECWWIDHYISGVPPTVGGGSLGTCVPSDNEPNDVAANANNLGFLGRGSPIRINGSISDENCDVVAPKHPGVRDADVYKFTVAFTDLVKVSVRARGTADACDGAGTNCSCGTDLAVASVWLFDETGSSLLGSDDPAVPRCDLDEGTCDDTAGCNVGPATGDCCCNDPIVGAITDPSVTAVLAPGTYTVVVASVAQISKPEPDDPGASGCSVDQGLDSPNDDAGPTTGDYELNLAVVERSTITVTQYSPDGGTFDSKLLVQALTTFSRVADPFATVMIDSGELGDDAVALYANDVPWVNNLTLSDIVPGDPNFVPGVCDDGAQVAVQFQHVDVDILAPPTLSQPACGDQAAVPVSATVTHRVQPPTVRGCELIESACAYIQGPNDKDQDAIAAAITSTLFFTVADDFTLAADTTINSVTFWLAGAGAPDLEDFFDIEIRLDEPVIGGCQGPGSIAPGGDFPNLNPEVIRPTTLNNADRVTFNLTNENGCGFNALAGQKYWLHVVQDFLEGSAVQQFFMLSDNGVGSNGLGMPEFSYRDLQDTRDTYDDPNNPTETNCPDFSGEGDGVYDCNPFIDDGDTADCDEAAEGNGDGDGDITDINLAFCLGKAKVRPFTKDLPWDVACGNWYIRSGGIIWSQPSDGAAGGVINVSDRSFIVTENDEGQQAADDFTLLEDTTILDIHWRGNYNTNSLEVTYPQGDRFTIQLWSDDGGLPGALVKEYGTPPSFLTNADIMRVAGEFSGNPGRTIYDYWLNLGPGGLDDPIAPSDFPGNTNANTTVWLSIINNSIGTPFQWFWSDSETGNFNGQAASRDIADPWSGGGRGRDFSFDLTIGGTEKIIAGKSVQCPPLMPIATGLGYYFDTQNAYINGYQTKQPGGEADQNRWRTVFAPWKFYADIAVDPLLASSATCGQIRNLFIKAGLEPPDDPDGCNALLKNVKDGKTIVGIFEGLAAFDVNTDTYGIEVGGQIDRLCNGQIIEVGNPSDVLNQRLWVKGLCFDNQVATMILHPHASPECFDDFECPGDNICFIGKCCEAGDKACCNGDTDCEAVVNSASTNVCVQIANVYGDADSDGDVDLFDLFCILGGFAGDFSTCPLERVDLNPCCGDGDVDLFDLFAVLGGFSDEDPCCNCPPPDGGTFCGEDGLGNCSPPLLASAASQSDDLGVSRGRPAGRGTAADIKLVPSSKTAQAGDVISVDVYVSASNLRGYELSAVATGGRSGTLELVSVSIEDREDFLLNGVENVKALDESTGRLAAATYGGGVSSAGSAYVGTFSFRASADATGAFRVELREGAGQILVDAEGDLIDVGRVSAAVIRITAPIRGR